MERLDLYRDMALARAFELAIDALWRDGRISGEMHLGTGEEAVAAGVCAHLVEGDAIALDHRATPFLALLGVDLSSMVAEMLGYEGGLCRGQGGHMHLLDPDHLAASSGIVGSSGPMAVGFALAAQHLRPERVAVATFGDGAMNQGMLMEALNLAAGWRLPVVFVCKDNGWAISTRTDSVSGGSPTERASAFGLVSVEVDGLDPVAVYEAAGVAIQRARRGEGPSFLRARCSRLDGHFLGDLLVRVADHPLTEGGHTLSQAIAAALTPGGASLGARARSMAHMLSLLGTVRSERRESRLDPIRIAQEALRDRPDELARIEVEVAERVARAVAAAGEG